MRARIIALEGIDQSGKRTQARLLANHLRRRSFKVRTLSFPIYESPAGRQIQRFLHAKQNYPPRSLHLLYSLNRWENQKLINDMMNGTDFLIADRYSSSNLAYGVSRGINLDWLEKLDDGLPLASLVIVLDVSVPASFTRKSKGRDVHESDRHFLFKVRRTYRVLAKKLDWKIVDGTGPVEEVHSAVWGIVRRKFRLPS